MSAGFKDFQEKGLYFRNAMAVQDLEKFMGYRTEWEEDGNRNYLDGTMKHLVRLDA